MSHAARQTVSLVASEGVAVVLQLGGGAAGLPGHAAEMAAAADVRDGRRLHQLIWSVL